MLAGKAQPANRRQLHVLGGGIELAQGKELPLCIPLKAESMSPATELTYHTGEEACGRGIEQPQRRFYRRVVAEIEGDEAHGRRGVLGEEAGHRRVDIAKDESRPPQALLHPGTVHCKIAGLHEVGQITEIGWRGHPPCRYRSRR